MSGHSKWSTIKRQKGVNDAKRGNLFSKLVKAISVATKTGGANIESNLSLKMAILAAKNANMPKTNIDRAIANASKEDVNLEELSYEGFAPGGIGIIVEVTTDNRNRTAAEIKTIFEKGGGSLGSLGSVSFNFEPKGLLFLKIQKNIDEEMLKLIDLGVEDIEPFENGLEVYVNPSELFNMQTKLENAGFEVGKAEFIQKPKSTLKSEDPKQVIRLLELFEDHEDVQKVYTNLEIV